jgi:hypothetical protein
MLVVANAIKGVQLHDARLAAFMKAYDIPQILTFNTDNFVRFSHVQTVHPKSLYKPLSVSPLPFAVATLSWFAQISDHIKPSESR